jgi:hypothetical protein
MHGDLGIGARGTLYKVGRTTQFTTGEYGGLETVHLHRTIVKGEEVRSTTVEHSITSPSVNKWFSDVGDSGAFIIDKDAQVVGLLFAGASANNATYFTHIKDVFDDIMAVTGALDVRIME